MVPIHERVNSNSFRKGFSDPEPQANGERRFNGETFGFPLWSVSARGGLVRAKFHSSRNNPNKVRISLERRDIGEVA